MYERHTRQDVMGIPKRGLNYIKSLHQLLPLIWGHCKPPPLYELEIFNEFQIQKYSNWLNTT